MPNLTADEPLKFVPVIVTSLPTAPLVGEKDEIVGGVTVCVPARPVAVEKPRSAVAATSTTPVTTRADGLRIPTG